MDLSYEAKIDDVIEPHVRHFLRSATFFNQRFARAVWAALIAPVVAYGLMRMFTDDASLIIVALLLAALTTPVAVWSTFENSARKRICKHMERVIGGQFPATVTFTVAEERLMCRFLDTEFIFRLENLKKISEDAGQLELLFGDIWICTIPLRAFRDASQKSLFLSAIKRVKE